MAHIVPVSLARRLLGDPLLQWQWEVVIPDPPSIVLASALGMSLRARSASIPGVSSQTHETRYGPFTFVHPGKKSYPRQYAVKFEEGTLNPVFPGFRLWHDVTFDETVAYGLPEQALMANIWLRLLGGQQDKLPVLNHAMHLYYAYPAQVADAPVAYEADGLLFLDVTFSYDYWRWEPWPF